MKTSNLFAPLDIAGLKLSNRIVVSPMCQYSCEDGFATDWHLVHLGSRAVGGAALVIVEATAVTPEGRITPFDMGLWKDAQIEPLRRITDFLHSQGAYAGIQLAHAGRKASMSRPWEKERYLSPEEGGWANVMAPSALPFAEHYGEPQALDKSQIVEIRNAFKDAALRSLDAGFDVLEVHAAHGYLLHEFLSPLSNKRSDEYGGSFENRARFLLETVDAVRPVWPHGKPLFVRISATDWADGGWNIDESVELAKLLKGRGVDLIDVSSGGLIPNVKIPLGPGYQTVFAERIKRDTGLLTGTVGMITDAVQAEHVLRTGQADVVFLARELLRDPYWPLHAADALKSSASWPAQYARAAQDEVALREPIFED
jgi:2,4-dienoyl-CoA reductase-like NADH-dependent reductase (Old Yellow Enzyme family)